MHAKMRWYGMIEEAVYDDKGAGKSPWRKLALRGICCYVVVC